MKSEYITGLLAIIGGMILAGALGCSDSTTEAMPAPGEEASANVPLIPPMNYNDPKYSDQEVIEHKLKTDYADFNPASAAARIPIIQGKLAKSEKGVASASELIEWSKGRIEEVQKELTEFPPEYLSWGEYMQTKTDRNGARLFTTDEEVYKYRKEMEETISNETNYRDRQQQFLEAHRFWVKYHKAEIEYLKSM